MNEGNLGPAARFFGNDDDSDEWEENEDASEQTTCLFCPLQFRTIAVALDHCRTEHNFDLLDLKNKYNMDFYSYIQMINYIRIQKPDPKIITESGSPIWNDDAYLKPGETESWLTYDFDDLGTAPSTPHYAIDGKTPISNLSFADLQRQIQDLTLQLIGKDQLLETSNRAMAKMKEVMARVMAEDPENHQKTPIQVGHLSLSGDSDYFDSYSHFGIHHEMLNDRIRTESYRDAILKNPNQFKDKTVLDVGCGTGILSLFSAKAGAGRVIGIDQSEIIYKAMDIIRENGFDSKITLIRGRVENAEIPAEKVDIIVSEWMGYFLLFEGMLDSFIYARDKHLAPNGLILPNRCNIQLAGGSDMERYAKLIGFWDDVYGFSMKCMKSDVIHEALVETVAGEAILTNSVVLTEIDLMRCTTSTCDFSTNFALTAERSGVLTCLVGYFDTFFDLEEKIWFSTGPKSERTHWQQTVFYLKDLVEMKAGDTIEGSLVCSRHKKNIRGLLVTITLGSNKYKYYLD